MIHFNIIPQQEMIVKGFWKNFLKNFFSPASWGRRNAKTGNERQGDGRILKNFFSPRFAGGKNAKTGNERQGAGGFLKIFFSHASRRRKTQKQEMIVKLFEFFDVRHARHSARPCAGSGSFAKQNRRRQAARRAGGVPLPACGRAAAMTFAPRVLSAHPF